MDQRPGPDVPTIPRSSETGMRQGPICFDTGSRTTRSGRSTTCRRGLSRHGAADRLKPRSESGLKLWRERSDDRNHDDDREDDPLDRDDAALVMRRRREAVHQVAQHHDHCSVAPGVQLCSRLDRHVGIVAAPTSARFAPHGGFRRNSSDIACLRPKRPFLPPRRAMPYRKRSR